MRDWLTVLRGLLGGGPVTHEGPTLTLRGVPVVPSGPGLDPIRAVMRACRPELVQA